MQHQFVPVIKKLREDIGVSQADLALSIGVNVSTLRNWESGGRGFDSILKIARLCKALDCEVSDLFQEK